MDKQIVVYPYDEILRVKFDFYVFDYDLLTTAYRSKQFCDYSYCIFAADRSTSIRLLPKKGYKKPLLLLIQVLIRAKDLD